MRLVPESDVGFALATGAFTVAFFLVAMLAVTILSPVELGRRELVGFVLGFAVFVAIYFGSMRADVLLKGDSYEDD